MKIRLNGSVKLDGDITFDNLDIELFNHSSTDGYSNECIIGDYDELVSLDEYLGEMVGDYADIIISDTGITINADINGSLNILRKYNKCTPRLVKQARDNGFLDNPIRLRVA